MMLMEQYSSGWIKGRFHCGCSEGPCWIYTNDVSFTMLIDMYTFGLNQPREWLDPCKYAHCVFTILFCISYLLLWFTPSTSSSLPHQAISGQAVDRHLNGLKLIAAEVGMETPSLFKDVAYTRSVMYILFTSNVHIVVKVLVAYIPGHTNKSFIRSEEISFLVLVSSLF